MDIRSTTWMINLRGFIVRVKASLPITYEEALRRAEKPELSKLSFAELMASLKRGGSDEGKEVKRG